MSTEDALLLLLQSSSITTARGSSASSSPGHWIPAPGKAFLPTRLLRLPSPHQSLPHQRGHTERDGTAKMSNILGFRQNHCKPCVDARQPMYVHGQLWPSLQSQGMARGLTTPQRSLKGGEPHQWGFLTLLALVLIFWVVSSLSEQDTHAVLKAVIENKSKL